MDIYRDAPAVARAEAKVAAPADRVFAILADVASWPRWNPDVPVASIAGPFVPGTLFHWRVGRAAITSIVQDADPPRFICWTGKTRATRAVHLYRLAPEGDHTLVITEESWDGLLVRAFPRRMNRRLQAWLDAGLRHLKSVAERGGAWGGGPAGS